MDVWSGIRSDWDLRGVVIDVGYFYSVVGCLVSESSNELKDKQIVRLWAVKCQTSQLMLAVDKIWKHFKILNLNPTPQIQLIGKDYEKYSGEIEAILGISTTTGNLVNCTVTGFNLLVREVECETFTYVENKLEPSFVRLGYATSYPCLVVSMDDEASIIKIDNPKSHEVVGNCGISGSSFYQIAKLLSPNQTIGDFLSSENYCMMDKYSLRYSNVSSMPDIEKNTDGISTLLFIMINSIGRITSLYADIHSINKVFFVRSFIDSEPNFMKTLSSSIKYWSSGKVEAVFLRHESFVGITGALINKLDLTEREKSWHEMYAFSSGIFPKEECAVCEGANVTKMVLDRSDTTLVPCPQIKNIHSYLPDVLNLSDDHEARHVIIGLARSSKFLFVKKHETSANITESRNRQVSGKLNYFEQHPYGFGIFVVRIFNEILVQFRNEFIAEEMYLEIKISENEAAMTQLIDHLKTIDRLDSNSRMREAIESTVAGNIFDSGSVQVTQLVEKGNFGFREAKENLLSRKWFRNDVELWLKRMDGPPHKAAAVFVDNSGADFLLGIVPFSRELIKRGTKVIICAFTHPSLNDVLYSEAKELLDRVGLICPIVKEALGTGKLIAMPTGQRAPSLDLCRIDHRLAAMMKEVDLIVLDGMGRGVLSNLHARVDCDLINIGALKEDKMCSTFGAVGFSPFFRFVPATV